jgi:hypothetical protein
MITPHPLKSFLPGSSHIVDVDRPPDRDFKGETGGVVKKLEASRSSELKKQLMPAVRSPPVK